MQRLPEPAAPQPHRASPPHYCRGSARHVAMCPSCCLCLLCAHLTAVHCQLEQPRRAHTAVQHKMLG